jgi:hypothetical protein
MLKLAQQAQGGLPHSDRTGMAWLMLAQVFAKQGDAAAARNAVQAVLDNLSSTVDDGHPVLLEARQLGLLLGG